MTSSPSLSSRASRGFNVPSENRALVVEPMSFFPYGLRWMFLTSIQLDCSNCAACIKRTPLLGFGSEARRWNLRRAANPIRDEAHILKAFDIEGSQAGGLSSLAQEFCRPLRSCSGEDSITRPA